MKVLEEKNGVQLGINENPDVMHLPEEKRFMVIEADGDEFVGNEKTIRRLFAKLTQ